MSRIDDQSERKKDWNADVSSLLKNIYRCADKTTWYDSVASAYDRTRPRYPQEILARMQEIAKLEPRKSVLEIGAGPGIVTIELAKLGAEMVSLEPSQAAWAIARAKCADYPNVEVINTTFEDWNLANKKFDVVVAATSFHWITPEARYIKTSTALKDNGLLVLLWNTPPQPSWEMYQDLQDIYQTHAPELDKYEGHQEHQENIGKMAQGVIDSGYFQNQTSDRLVVTVHYTVEDYLTLLSTLSPYIGLRSAQRESLFSELQQRFEQLLGERQELDLSYLSLLQTVRKS
ncbi:MAG: class I SAM-dependent methyltransferase [Cyanobacteria bacterium J06600_6]